MNGNGWMRKKEKEIEKQIRNEEKLFVRVFNVKRLNKEQSYYVYNYTIRTQRRHILYR